MMLSIIIPVYNSRSVLERCLQGLVGAIGRDCECIVVDDASSDDVQGVAAKYGAWVRRLARNSGPAVARNRGADLARGEILLFLDADVCVHTDTVDRVRAHFGRDPSSAAVIGSYDDTPADPHLVSQYKNLLHHYVHQTSRPEAWTFWAGCGAIRRDVFQTIGGFDERYRRPCIEDIELGARLRRSGYRIALDPAIQVTHLKRWTLWSLIRTDVRDRAIPWLRVMLRERNMPPDLNVTYAHRASVALVAMLPLLSVLALLPLAAPAAVLPVAGLTAVGGALLYLNRDLYRFFTRQRGGQFTVVAIALHWLYYAYCGVAVIITASLHARDVMRGLWGRPPQPQPTRSLP